jgi:hypothetical protein
MEQGFVLSLWQLVPTALPCARANIPMFIIDPSDRLRERTTRPPHESTLGSRPINGISIAAGM